jgi:capsid assembly protein Gp20
MAGYIIPFGQDPNMATLGDNEPQDDESSMLSGLVDAFANIFAAATPPNVPDTSMELIALAQQNNPMNDAQYGGSTMAYVQERLTLAQSRKTMHHEYEEMEDNFPEIASSLDIYADNATAKDSYSDDVITIVTDDDEVGALFMVVKDILKLDDMLWSRAREVARVGEYFDEVCFDATGFISRLKPLPTPMMARNEDRYGRLPFDGAFSQMGENFKEEISFGSWQILHYRLLKRPDDIYGTGLLYPIRRLAKKLDLVEQALLITRLTRAHQKNVFDIPVDGLPPDERRKVINDAKREYRKRRIINPRTQKLDLEQNPLAAEDDIFLGSTKDNKVVISQIGGDASIGQLADIEFWQNKLFSALKVPKAYVGIERDVNAKATLTEQDVQFARTVHRIQMVLQAGIRELFDRALTLYGRDPKEVNYTISFPAISLIDELRNWEVENMKLQAAFQFKDLIRPSDDWMLREYLGFSQDEVNVILAGQQPDPEMMMMMADLDADDDEDAGAEDEAPAAEAVSLGESIKRRRRRFEALMERAKKVHVLGGRGMKRQTALEQQKDRREMAESMSRYKSLARRTKR